jgi:hypoxanthine phosphoribosyltransferase
LRRIISQQEIEEGVDRLAADVRRIYGNEALTVVGILTGSIVLLADLIRQLNMPLRLGLLQASSYRGKATTRSALKIKANLLPDLKDRHVLVVDDIFDTGHTLVEVIAQLAHHHPASIRSAVLLKKEGRCEVAIEPDLAVFDIPNEFVVGYGLDFDDMYRDLPYIAVLEEDDIQRPSNG